MQIFFIIMIALAVGYSAGVNRKNTKDDDTIAGLLVELEEKSAYFHEVSSYLEENEGLDYIRNYLQRSRAADEDAEMAARHLERILASIEEAGKMQHVTEEARERIRSTVKSEKKKPIASRAFDRIRKWL